MKDIAQINAVGNKDSKEVKLDINRREYHSVINTTWSDGCMSGKLICIFLILRQTKQSGEAVTSSKIMCTNKIKATISRVILKIFENSHSILWYIVQPILPSPPLPHSFQSVYHSVRLSIFLFIPPSISQSVYLPICLSVSPFVHPSVRTSICPFGCSSVHQPQLQRQHDSHFQESYPNMSLTR